MRTNTYHSLRSAQNSPSGTWNANELHSIQQCNDVVIEPCIGIASLLHLMQLNPDMRTMAVVLFHHQRMMRREVHMLIVAREP